MSNFMIMIIMTMIMIKVKFMIMIIMICLNFFFIHLCYCTMLDDTGKKIILMHTSSINFFNTANLALWCGSCDQQHVIRTL